METAEPLARTADRAARLLRDSFCVEPQWIAAAPGRVNLIGEHTDYNDGFVLPMAIERYTVVAAARGTEPGNVVEIVSDAIGDRQTIRLGDPSTANLPGWCQYFLGVFELLAHREMPCGSLRAAVVSTVPLGSGLSSSAALEVATATLVEAVLGQPLDGRDKARLCQQVEHQYVNMPCGIMDQFSSALCQAGEAMRLDCRSLEATSVPLDDPAVAVLIVNSNVKHELSGSEYPQRRAQCETAARALGVPSLRDATPTLLETEKEILEPVVYRRARHVIGEIARVLEFSAAAAQRDWNRAGQLMDQSHDSLRDDYEVSCPEIDELVAAARQIGAAGGVYGSRITGGGFGGCTVTLCRTAQADEIADKILAEYRRRTGQTGIAFVTRPARGAHVVMP